MKNTMNSFARRRAWVVAALGDYRDLTDDELSQQTVELHQDLALSDRFSLTGARGLRQVVIERLIAIDGEHRRRQHAA